MDIMDGYYNAGCNCTNPSGYAMHSGFNFLYFHAFSDTLVHQLSSAARRNQTPWKSSFTKWTKMIYLAVVQRQNSHLPHSTCMFLAMSTWFFTVHKYCVSPCSQMELPLFYHMVQTEWLGICLHTATRLLWSVSSEYDIKKTNQPKNNNKKTPNHQPTRNKNSHFSRNVY